MSSLRLCLVPRRWKILSKLADIVFDFKLLWGQIQVKWNLRTSLGAVSFLKDPRFNFNNLLGKLSSWNQIYFWILGILKYCSLVPWLAWYISCSMDCVIEQLELMTIAYTSLYWSSLCTHVTYGFNPHWWGFAWSFSLPFVFWPELLITFLVEGVVLEAFLFKKHISYS